MIESLPNWMVIADPSAVDSPFLDAVEAVLAGGVTLIQFRAKHLAASEQWKLGRAVAELCAAYRAKLHVNDRADLAYVLGADGVHLPANGLPVEAARRLLPDGLIGVSCHSIADVIEATEDGADYVTLSPIFETSSKPGYGPALGCHKLTTSTKAATIPVYALGGITPERVDECLTRGAHGIATMGGVLRGDISKNVQDFLRVLS